jgi:hypothetical protein
MYVRRVLPIVVLTNALIVIASVYAQSPIARLPAVEGVSYPPSPRPAYRTAQSNRPLQEYGRSPFIQSANSAANLPDDEYASDFDSAEPEMVSGWAYGYDGGFVSASPSGLKLDTKESDYLMRLRSWGQFRHAYFDSKGPRGDLNQFEIERLRLVFDGHAYSRDFKYFFQIDFDSDASEVGDMLDYYITYDIGHDVWGMKNNKVKLRMGKWKIPFARSREESGTRLEFADRSMAGVFFDFDRSLGLGLLGKIDWCIAPIDWHVSLVNGIKTGGFLTGRRNVLDTNLAFAARFTSVLHGDYGKDGEPDLDYRMVPAWRVGMGVASSHVNRNTGLVEYSQYRVVDSGALINSILPAGVTAYDLSMFAMDSHVKYHGMSVITEYFFRSLSNFSGAPVDNLFDHGLLIQTGFFIKPKHVELIARWSRIVGNSGSLGARYESADEVAGGVVWYIRGQKMKVTFDATHVNGAPINDRALNILRGDDGWLFRTQFQFMF